MTEPVALTGPQRIIRRVVAERRAGAPDEMIAKYAITEALHLTTGHDGPAADCTRCHQATARAVQDVRDSGDMTGASIVVPDPLNLPAYAWGESVTWNQGRILVPLNRDNETVADLVLDEDDAGTLAAMLDDAAGATEGTDWGEPGAQWTCGVRRPDGSTILDEDAPSPDDESAVRAYVDAMQDGNGYRKALLRRDVSAWREADAQPVARGAAEQTPHSEGNAADVP